LSDRNLDDDLYVLLYGNGDVDEDLNSILDIDSCWYFNWHLDVHGNGNFNGNRNLNVHGGFNDLFNRDRDWHLPGDLHWEGNLYGDLLILNNFDRDSDGNGHRHRDGNVDSHWHGNWYFNELRVHRSSADCGIVGTACSCGDAG